MAASKQHSSCWTGWTACEQLMGLATDLGSHSHVHLCFVTSAPRTLLHGCACDWVGPAPVPDVYSVAAFVVC
jgi:hypothetical protein